jgi:hypothetical protein
MLFGGDPEKLPGMYPASVGVRVAENHVFEKSDAFHVEVVVSRFKYQRYVVGLAEFWAGAQAWEIAGKPEYPP